MRRLLVPLIIMLALVVHAQDVIVKKDGSTILSKVLEVNQDNVKYKKHSNPNGPTYTVSIADIMAINYANGEKDTFDAKISSSESQSANNSSASKLIEKKPDARNAEIINMYKENCSLVKNIPEHGKKATACYSIWEIEPSSVMSNEDIEVKIFRKAVEISPSDYAKLGGGNGVSYGHIFTYLINIQNKTNHTIYVDRGHCFRIQNNGVSYCYFNQQEQTTIGHGSGSGVSVGLGSIAGALGVGGVVGTLAGGVAVGGGSSNTVSTTYTQQRILAIPPHGNINLTDFKKLEKKPQIIVEHAEYFLPTTYQDSPKQGMIKAGEVLSYNENSSPWKRQYIVTYSNDINFQTFSTMQINCYLCKLIGTRRETWTTDLRTYVYQYSKYIQGVNDYTIIDWGHIE